MKVATTIGSMPHTEPLEAVSLILENTPLVPAWPQLPLRSWRENMTAQYSEGFPGIKFDDVSRRVVVDEVSAPGGEMEKFYEKYLARDVDYFAITPQASGGIYALKERLGAAGKGDYFEGLIKTQKRHKEENGSSENIPPATYEADVFPIGVKCQTAGPITYSMMLKTSADRPVFFDENLRDAALKIIAMKSAWQIKFFEGLASVLFLDEPYLSAYGSAFTSLSREDVVGALKTVVEDVRDITSSLSPRPGLRIGAHCCGNTDWTLLIESGLDIISFDSYNFMDSLLMTPEDVLKKFLDSGGILAFGIVPTARDEILNQTDDMLKEKLRRSVDLLALRKNIDREKLEKQIIITPACGLGSLDKDTARKAMALLKALSL